MVMAYIASKTEVYVPVVATIGVVSGGIAA